MCGIFGIYGHPEASVLTYLGLQNLQHRGQESAGIVTSDGKNLYERVRQGLVSEVFRSEEKLRELRGHLAIGHVRYSTTGESMPKNAQPFGFTSEGESFALAHNGNLVNSHVLHQQLESEGTIFQTTTDTELIPHLFAKSREYTIEDKLCDALNQVEGSYSLVFMSKDKIIAAKDRYSFRPLCILRIGDAHIVASESCVSNLLEAEYVREIKPDEMVIIDHNGITSRRITNNIITPRKCIFEHIYFARPDSFLFGDKFQVERFRKIYGRELAIKRPCPNADYCSPVPDSGTHAAIGFSREAGIKYDMIFIRSHYIGRIFIEPQQTIRFFGVKLKLSPVTDLIRGGVVVIVDDSIVRGTTSRKLVEMIRNCGAREVHLRISSPPYKYSCFYGIDTPTREELIATNMKEDEICKHIKADSLGYLPIGKLHNSMHDTEPGYCDACFTGKYPTPTPKDYQLAA